VIKISYDITIEKLLKSLKEEVSYRRGIRWFVESSGPAIYTHVRDAKPRRIIDAYDALKIDNEYIICDTGANQVVALDENLDVLWEFGEFGIPGSDSSHLRGPRRIDYNPDLNRILISDFHNDRVVEIDRNTREVTNILTRIGAHTLERPYAQYDYHSNHIFVTDYNNAYAAEVDWNGTIHWSFGVWGVNGSDTSHLWGPYGVCPSHVNNRLIIADSVNNRVIVIDKDDNSFIWYCPITNPSFARQERSTHFCITNPLGSTYPPYTSPVSRCSGYMCVITTWSGAVLWWHPNSGSNFVRLTDDYTVLVQDSGGVQEYDLRSIELRNIALPQGGRLSDMSLDAGATGNSNPIFTYPYRHKTFYAKSTQDATLNIQIMKPYMQRCDIFAHPDYIWETFDSISLPANTLVPYPTEAQFPIARLQVEMGGTAGTVELWYHMH